MPVPPVVRVIQNDTPKPVDFPNWRLKPQNPPIAVVGVETDHFGDTVALPPAWNSVWKFINQGLGSGGIGIKGELIFDRRNPPDNECVAFYDNVLWPARVPLKLICEYAQEPQEILEVQLVY